MEIRYPKNSRFLLVAMLGSILACLSYLIYAYNPKEAIQRMFTTLSPGSLAFNLWSRPPYDLVSKIYIFNVTNADEFLRGEQKLRFNQVGPYSYKEMLVNTNTHFNDNGTLTFEPKRILEFVPEKSVGDPKQDFLNLPNIPLLGITASLKDYSIFTKMAVASISNHLDSKPVLNLTIEEYLWGYEDPLVKLANGFLPHWIDFPKFGILDRLYALDNGSNIVTINVDPTVISKNELLSEEERSRAYSIQRWNGSPGFSQWGYKEDNEDESESSNTRCNVLEGSFEGTIYPRNIKPNSTFQVYRPAFCRYVPMVHDGSGYSDDGFFGYAFKMSPMFLETPDVNPNNACYCKNGECLPKGLGDMTPCYYGIPVVLSQPHFLNTDPTVTEKVDGLHPTVEDHGSVMLIHDQMGVPLSAKLRIQINLNMPENNIDPKTRPFSNLVIPLFWVELEFDKVPTQVYLYILLLYQVLPIVQEVCMYAFAVLGVALVIGSAFAILFYPPGSDEDHFGLNVNYSPLKIITLKAEHLNPDIRICK